MPTTHERITSSLLTETLISFGQAAKRFPPCRQGKPVSPATPFRWAKYGINRPDGTRVKLESIRVGGRWLTSVEALARFCDRLSSSDESTSGPSPSTPRTPSLRQRENDLVENHLKKIGL